jgi:hypothetical protein
MVCLILSALCGVFAGGETGQLFRLEELKSETAPKNPFWVLSPPDQERIDSAAQKEPQVLASTLESMRDVRALTLISLSIACALTFVGASRMLKPFGLPREGVRRLLAGSALAAGILRTIDGAQWAVVVKRQAALLASAFASLPSNTDEAKVFRTFAPVIPAMSLFGSVLWTLIMAGAFLLVSQYFRSETVRRIVEFRDSHPD